MNNKIESLDSLKRTIYIFSSIIAVMYLIFNLFFEHTSLIKNLLTVFVIIYFLISLLFLLLNVFMQFHEVSNIVLISIYLIGKFYETLQDDLFQVEVESLGDFIIWMPLYVIYLFLVLGRKNGLLVNSSVILLHLLISIPFYNHLTDRQIGSIIHYFVASIIYLFVIYSFQYVITIHAEFNILKENAYIDSLTDIPNRRRSMFVFEEMLKKAENKNHPFSLIFFDIDHFKMINDQFGHDIGDVILKRFTTLIAMQLSDKIFFGRWGGEEFILFIPAYLEEAVILAEALRQLIEKEEFSEVNGVTASFGVAGYRKGDTMDSLFKRADLGLYEAKNHGRNRVMKLE